MGLDTLAERKLGVGANNLKMELDCGVPGRVADALRMAKLGTRLRSFSTSLYRQAPALGNPYDGTAVPVITLPDDAKAQTIGRVYARAGTAGTGEMTVVAPGATLASGQVQVTPSGNIAFLAADAITDVDVDYKPLRADVVTFVGSPASGVIALPTQITSLGAIVIIEAEATAGGAGGKLRVLAPGSGTPATGQCRLSVNKATVLVYAADGATSVRLKLGIVPKIDENAMLEGPPFARDVSSPGGALT